MDLINPTERITRSFSIVRHNRTIWQIEDAFIYIDGRKGAEQINTSIRSNCLYESWEKIMTNILEEDRINYENLGT